MKEQLYIAVFLYVGLINIPGLIQRVTLTTVGVVSGEGDHLKCAESKHSVQTWLCECEVQIPNLLFGIHFYDF